MSRSYRKPVRKLNQVTWLKKEYNRKNRRKPIESGGNYYKKLNPQYEICDMNTGVLDKETIEKWYGGREYKIRRK